MCSQTQKCFGHWIVTSDPAREAHNAPPNSPAAVAIAKATLASSFFLGGCAIPGVCMSVCLLTISRKNYWPELHENLTRYVSLGKEFFGRHPHLDLGAGILKMIFQHCTIGYFSTIWLIAPLAILRKN